jgi:hypothetical protein
MQTNELRTARSPSPAWRAMVSSRAHALPALSRRWLFVPVSAALFVLNHIYKLSDGALQFTEAVLLPTRVRRRAVLQPFPVGGDQAARGWNLAGQFADKLAVIAVVEESLGLLLSAAAHLAMLGVVVARRHLSVGARKLQN